MTSTALRYVLFPRLTVAENELSDLLMLFPHLFFLQVIRPPAVPSWAKERVSGWSVIEAPDLLDAISQHWKGYQDFAQLHGEDGFIASMARDWTARHSAETRLDIQSRLKGKGSEAREMDRSIQLLESGVFMEIARDFEEKELELVTDLAQAENIEREFQKILGVESIEEIEDSMGVLSPPLLPDGAAPSFMLFQRTLCWLRLFYSRRPEALPVFVILDPEALEEILEAVEKESKRAGFSPEVLQMPLFSIPSLSHVPAEHVLPWMQEMEGTGLLQACGDSLEAVLKAPGDPGLREKLAEKMGELQRHAASLLKNAAMEPANELTLTLTMIEKLTHEGLARCLDRQSEEAFFARDLPVSSPAFLSLHRKKG
jgi:hypothetical protein